MLLQSLPLTKTTTEPFAIVETSTSTSTSTPRPPLSKLFSGKLQKQLAQMKQKMPNINVRAAQKQLIQAQGVQSQLEPVFYQLAPKPTDALETVNLLWSGGVASTYRLCKLLFVHQRTVRPVYFAQNGLDARKSTHHERLTVRQLHKHIHEHHPSMKKKLLPIEMFDTPLRRNEKNRVLVDTIAHIFKTKSHRIPPFYLALAAFREQMHKPHTNVSNRALEIVLPAKGPLQMLRTMVEKWGVRERFKTPEMSLSSWFGDTKEKPSPPNEKLLSKCTHIVNAPQAANTDDERRHTAFAKIFGHIRFVLPCDEPALMHHLAEKYTFQHILQRTWSCREPVMTKRQIYHKSQKDERNTLFSMSDVPTGQCGHCLSCRQRMWDGVKRIED